MPKSVRESFVNFFGEDQAQKIEESAKSHKNGIHDEPGSDPFRWAIIICIGYECMQKDSYREHHNITVPWDDLKAWIKEHGDLSNHDGSVDYLALFAGAYNEYMEVKGD